MLTIRMRRFWAKAAGIIPKKQGRNLKREDQISEKEPKCFLKKTQMTYLLMWQIFMPTTRYKLKIASCRGKRLMKKETSKLSIICQLITSLWLWWEEKVQIHLKILEDKKSMDNQKDIDHKPIIRLLKEANNSKITITK